MRPERSARTAADAEAEQEVDLGRYWWSIVARWWLVVLCVAVGVLVGYLVSLGGGKLFQAKATVYVGQPLTPTSNAQVSGIQTNPLTISQIVKSESVVLSVASQVDVPPGRLREGITTRAVTGTATRVSQSQLVEVVVRGPWRRQSAAAANLLAGIVLEEVSAYPDAKIALLERQAAAEEEELAALEDAIDRYQAALEGGGQLEASEQLVLVSLLADVQQERGRIAAQNTQTALSLALARNVERGQIVTRAAATQVAARGRSSSMIVGAVIGLLLGVLAALLWEPVRSRIAR